MRAPRRGKIEIEVRQRRGGGRFNATQINCLKKGPARARLLVVYFSFVLNDLGWRLFHFVNLALLFQD